MKRDAAHYRALGRQVYEAGIVHIPVAAPRGWQQAARRAGYAEARDAWRGANPEVDEWEAMAEKNRAFCFKAMGK